MTELVHAPRLGLPHCGAPYGSPVSMESTEVTCPKCIEWLAMLTEAHFVRHGKRSHEDGMFRTWCGELEWPEKSPAPVAIVKRFQDMTCPGCVAAFDEMMDRLGRDGHA